MNAACWPAAVPRLAQNRFPAFAIPFVWKPILPSSKPRCTLVISRTERIPPEGASP